MKTLRLFPLLLLMLVAGAAMAETVDMGKARQAATTFLANNGAQTTGLTDVTTASGFTNVFVFTTENSFVLLAADDCVQPILGYSLTNRFDTENMPANKRAWIQGYSDEIRYAIEHQTRASAEVAQQWRDLVEGNPNTNRSVIVGPLLQTQWSQGDPYNLLCPGGSVTGCVATAMAQIMKYWNYPEHGIGSHSYNHPNYGVQSADFQSTYYDWSHMTNTYGYTSTTTQKMAVATLMYHCGVSVNMNYSPNASGAASAIVAEALKNYFNYSSQVEFHDRSGFNDNVWIGMLKADLNQNRPVWYRGTGEGGGHAFVFDGYDSNNYFHVNWGWAGYCDEYYSINSLNPGPGGPGSGSVGVFNDGQGAVFGIHPSDCVAGAPTNLTYTQDGRNVTLSWTAASGAASYNVYCNNNYVGNATSTTFTHDAPYGSVVYYVRSVDANGELSLSSNAVTFIVEYPTPVVDDLAATVSDNNVTLTWTAPEWCYPETPSATLNYGEGNSNYWWSPTYYGQRHLAADLAQYAGKAVYKVSTYVGYPGTYSLYIYSGAATAVQGYDDYYYTTNANLVYSEENLEVTISNGWYDFELSTPLILSGTDDLWVVVKQENTGAAYPVPSFNLPSHNANAFFKGWTSSNNRFYFYDNNSNYNCSWFINTYLTDGTYSYNLYRNGSVIANNLSETTYSDNNLADGIYSYYVKTNYYGGETDASNQVTVTIGNLPTTQTVALSSGINWFSSNVEITMADLQAALLEAYPSPGMNALVVKSKSDGQTAYNPTANRWIGSLTTLDLSQMYMVKVPAANEITLEGLPISPEDHPATIKNGANWIAYPLDMSMTVTEAFAGFPANGDVVKAKTGGQAQWNSAANRWIGSLTTLEPGKGYIYQSSVSGNRTFVFTSGAK